MSEILFVGVKSEDPLKIDSTQIDLKQVKILRWTNTASSKRTVINNPVQL